MSVPVPEFELRVARMSDALRSAGMRLTHQRLEIVRELSAAEDHPHVEGIYEAVSRRVPTISLDTVYRTVAVLVELGLASRLLATAGAVRYDPNVCRHHHFVCTSCGVVRDVDDRRLDAVTAPDSAAAFGIVDVVEVQLRGVCNACVQERMKQEGRKVP